MEFYLTYPGVCRTAKHEDTIREPLLSALLFQPLGHPNQFGSLDLLIFIDHRSLSIPLRWALIVSFPLPFLLFLLRAKQPPSPFLSSKRQQQLHRIRTLHL